MSDIWNTFHVPNCQHCHPHKNKFVVISCSDGTCLGFLINTKIANFVLKRPELLKSQVPIKSSDYWYLTHDSYLDCSQLYPFDNDDLNDGRGKLLKSMITSIKSVVSTSTTLEPHYIKLILAN